MVFFVIHFLPNCIDYARHMCKVINRLLLVACNWVLNEVRSIGVIYIEQVYFLIMVNWNMSSFKLPR